MKIKCKTCGGSGGKYKISMFGEIFIPCYHCAGKGKWYTNDKRKKASHITFSKGKR